MKNKIIIGTANFGNRYGILKEKAKLGQIKKILNNGHKLGLRYLDAAEDYNSFNQIKKKAKKYNIFIKIDFSKLNYNKNFLDFEKEFFKNLKNLGLNKVYALTFRKPEFILKKKNNQLVNKIKKLKNQKLIQKFGISIYKKKQFKKVINILKPDYIQIPVNFIFRDVINQKEVKMLKKKGIEIHARSLFLQGLLLNNFRKLPSKIFKGLKKKKLKKFFLKDKKYRISYCMEYALNKNIDKLLLGINSLKQLKDFLNYKKDKNINLKEFFFREKRLFNPLEWNY